MATHTQTWVKVNAPVDERIAELVSLLNRVEGLETLQSCPKVGRFVVLRAGSAIAHAETFFRLARKTSPDARSKILAGSGTEDVWKLPISRPSWKWALSGVEKLDNGFPFASNCATLLKPPIQKVPSAALKPRLKLLRRQRLLWKPPFRRAVAG